MSGPARRILMTIDAVGGVWRYVMDLASELSEHGFAFVFAGLGPAPSPEKREEAARIGEIVWLDAPLDWTTDDPAALEPVAGLIAALVERYDIDLVHLNLPSQAAGLDLGVPILVVSHSCVVSWFRAVRRSPVPRDWQWQIAGNRNGFDRADLILAPSRSHAELLRLCYGPIGNLHVVHNGSRAVPAPLEKLDMVFAAGRWWDDGKNGRVLDQAAALSPWPIAMAGANRGPNGQYLAISGAQGLGELGHGAVQHHMARAAIVVSPSVYEPFGLTPLEAANARAALVLADIPTYRELWSGAALFADPADPPAFADAISRLAADPALRRTLADRAHERAGQFSLSAQATRMADHYGQLLAEPLAVQHA